jgi:hypothetical protein
MRTLRTPAFGLVLAGLVGLSPAKAQEFSGADGNPGLFGIFDEVRTGGSFSVQPDDDSGLILRGEVLFRSFVPPFDSYLANTVLRPRVHVGGNLATGGDDQISQVYAGLTWNFPFLNDFFLEATFGFTAHDGPLDNHPGGPNLGCEILFRESVGVGAAFGQHWRVIVAVDHSSHANIICDGRNAGLTHAGVLVGYRF